MLRSSSALGPVGLLTGRHAGAHRWRASTRLRLPPALLSWAVLYVFFLVGWYRLPESIWGVYSLVDGRWAAWNTEFILRWGKFLDLSPFNIFSGMGSMFLPNLPWLNPGAWPLAWPLARMERFAVSYTIYLIEIAASIVLLGRVLGFGRVASHVAAQIHVLFLFPPFSQYFLALPWYSLAPVNAQLAAVMNCLLALTLVIGRLSRAANLACAGGIVFLTLIGILSAPMTVITYVPVYVLFGAVLVLGRGPTLRRLLWKIGAWLVTACILFVLGFGSYYKGTVETSARYLLYPASHADLGTLLTAGTWRALFLNHDFCEAPQALLCFRYKIWLFKVLALVGAAWWIGTGQRWQRAAGATVLLFEGGVHLYHLSAYVNAFGRLHVFSMSYLVWASYSLYAVLAVVALSIPAALRERRRDRTTPPGPGRANGRREQWALALIPACAVLIWFNGVGPHVPAVARISRDELFRSRLREPEVTPIVSYLIDHVGLGRRSPFRGYVASYFGDPSGFLRKALGHGGPRFTHQIYVDAREYLESHYGNRFAETELWSFGIPTVEEDGQWASRQLMAFTRELLASPGDGFHPSLLRIYRLDVPLLEALGVRYVISDAEFRDRDARLVLTEGRPDAGMIRLYELRAPNLATYSPTRIVRTGSFAETIEAVRQNSAALDSLVVTTEPVRDGLVPARAAVMHVGRDGFAITAESPGRSLVLLPVQFSHCLRMRSARGRGEPGHARLLRANLVQTALEFEGRIDAIVELKFGLLGEGRCRERDGAELDSLGVS